MTRLRSKSMTYASKFVRTWGVVAVKQLANGPAGWRHACGHRHHRRTSQSTWVAEAVPASSLALVKRQPRKPDRACSWDLPRQVKHAITRRRSGKTRHCGTWDTTCSPNIKFPWPWPKWPGGSGSQEVVVQNCRWSVASIENERGNILVDHEIVFAFVYGQAEHKVPQQRHLNQAAMAAGRRTAAPYKARRKYFQDGLCFSV